MKKVVNLITFSRIIGILLLLPIYKKISSQTFIIYLIILFLTDYIDGKLARKFKVQTLFGSILDTFADKFLGIVLMILIINKDPRIIILIYTEILISIVNVYGFIKNKNTSTIFIGKVKTWLIYITIEIEYINLLLVKVPSIVLSILIFSTFIIEIYVILNYISQLTKLKNKNFIKMKNKRKLNYKEIKYLLFNTEYYMNELKK